MRTFAIFACFLLFISCRKSTLASNKENSVIAISPSFFIKWQYPFATSSELVAKSIFQYSDNKAIKRSGSHLQVFGGYDWNSYTDKVYDLVSYGNSTVSLQSHNDLFSPAPKRPKWEIELVDGKPSRKISFVFYGGMYIPGDTALYYYSSNKQIQKIEYHSTAQGSSYLYTKNFTFDTNGNLQKVTSIYLKKPGNVLFSTQELFELYDTKTNPLMHLWLWDDLYYRTLSTNNFAKYTFQKFDASNNLVDAFSASLDLRYDASGNIILE